LLKNAGRKVTIDAEAERLQTALRLPQMRQLPLVEEAMGRQALALLRQLDAACTSTDDLAEATVESFEKHPDAEIITQFPRARFSQRRPGARRDRRRPIPLRRRPKA
jgi:hypothetical protein